MTDTTVLMESSDQWKIVVGKSPDTGKWHARIETPNDGCFTSPPCDTEQEAIAFREEALEVVKRTMAPFIQRVDRVN